MDPASGMNGYGLAASIIQSIASLGWPIALIVLACVYRKPVQTLLRRMKSAKGWGTELEFEEQLEEAEAVANSLPEAAKSEEKNTGKSSVTLDDVISYSPVGAIIARWRDIEDAIDKAYGLDDPETRESPNLRASRVHARLNKHLNPLYREMKHLRNLAAHTPDIGEEQARRFDKLARIFLNLLSLEQPHIVDGPASKN